MILYHGAVDAYLPSIEKEGLRPTPANQLHVRVLRPTPFGGVPGNVMKIQNAVYLTKREQTAKDFALFRSYYLIGKSGDTILSNPDGEGFGKTIGAIKLSKTPPLRSHPILLTLDVPANYHLIPDSRGSEEDMEAFYYPGTIPASCIKKVEKVTP